MRHAKLSCSPRLQSLLSVLQRAKRPLSSRELLDRSDVVALTAAISELRGNGAEIDCSCKVGEDGKKRYDYTLLKSPEVSN